MRVDRFRRALPLSCLSVARRPEDLVVSRSIVRALLAATLLVAASPGGGYAGGIPCCRTEDVADSDSLMNSLDSWQDLHRAYPVLLRCDDGDIAEGISEFVVHHLATHWNTFPELATVAQTDTAFGSWVVGHIDATTDWDETARIVRHAHGGGPARFGAFRQRVGEAARSANAESHKIVESPKPH